MRLGWKLIWAVAVLIIICAAGFSFLKRVVVNLDVVYSEYPAIAEYQVKGWVPFSRETLKEAKNIRQKADVDINASFIRFNIPQDEVAFFIEGAKKESEDHKKIVCHNDIQECRYFRADPERILRFDIGLESHLGDHEFVFLVDPVSGEVVGGARYPFKKYLVFD